ncbi:MAG: glycosyltransferase family 1 protein [bacterium]
MNIGIDARTLLENYYSGVNFYTFNLLKNLFELDRENQYRLFSNSFKNKDGLKIFKNYPKVKNRHFNRPNKFLNFSFTFLNFPKINRLLGGIDLFFLPNINFLAIDRKVPLITTIYDLSFERYPEFYSRKSNLWHKIINPPKLLKQSQKIITISECSKKDLIELYKIPAEKIEIIYPAVTEEFQPLSKNDEKLFRVKQKYNLPENFILYLGNLEPRKNIEGLIQSFEEFCKNYQDKLGSDLFLIIAGQAAWKYQTIFKLAEKSVKREKIKFLGYVEESDKPALYNLAKIFVYLSFYEGFGLPPLEAMACGTPVVTSANSSLPEVVGDGGLLVNPYKLNELSDAFYQLLADESLAKILRERGLAQAKKFSWPKSAGKLLAIFNSFS